MEDRPGHMYLWSLDCGVLQVCVRVLSTTCCFVFCAKVVASSRLWSQRISGCKHNKVDNS